jgi:uncharacterized membrane protein YkvA (DUF1232 family)
MVDLRVGRVYVGQHSPIFAEGLMQEAPVRAPPDRSTWALALALLYALSPVDLITDVAPGLGLVDDLGVAGVVLGLVAWWRRGGTWRDLTPLLVALIYDVVPTDLLPDVIPLVGRVDDLVATLVGLGVWWWQRRARDTPPPPG